MHFLAVFAKIARRHIEYIPSASVAKRAKKTLFRLVAVQFSSGYTVYKYNTPREVWQEFLSVLSHFMRFLSCFYRK